MSKMNYNTNEDDWWNAKKKSDYPHPPYIDTTPDTTSPMYMLEWLFCGIWKCQDWKKIYCRGAHQPHSQMNPSNVHTDDGIEGWCALPAALNLTLIDSLNAPNWIQRGCILASISPSRTGGTVTEVDSGACLAGPEASSSWDSWGVDGRWWQMVCGGLSLGEVGLRIWRNATLLPSEAHRNHPPLILPLLPPSFLAHRTPDAELWPLISGLLSKSTHFLQ